MTIGILKSKPKKNIINKKSVAGAALATATAAGAAAVSPKGKSAINKLVNKNSNQETPDMLGTWLKDAYAMEEAQIKTLKGIIKDFKDDKVISDKLKQHLRLTEKQKSDVEKCLKMIGHKPAKSKELIGRIFGMGPAVDTKLFKDKKVKDFLMLHSGEHFEHASYLALAAAAEASDNNAIATVMTRIAKEEKEMAAWGEKTLPAVVRQHLKA